MRRMQIITEIFSTIPGTTSAHAENTCAGEVFSLADENYLRVRGEYVDLVLSGLKDWELPPRTRRIQSHQNDYRMNGGTTSAYAENTADVLHRESCLGNYLRVRGEYISESTLAAGPPELPPRTRRIPCHSPQPPPVVGTTSAYAENTMIRFSMLTDLGNYLRVRGEYSMTVTDQFAQAELPPRTRRILGVLDARFKSRGTTSAYAENTQTTPPPPRWNYLRVRGEYTNNAAAAAMELPPRTRRIHMVAKLFLVHQGTTSAYAENTFLAVTISWNDANYLRVRGEYILSGIAYSVEEELPPRTRRIPRNAAMTSSHAGTTSAYAENTFKWSRIIKPKRNYLRVRGEYPSVPAPPGIRSELPPRTRRIPLDWHLRWILGGTTSACAENTQ